MGGPCCWVAMPVTTSLLLLSFLYGTILAAQPDLLHFVLNVKPGIREPTAPPPTTTVKSSIKHTGGAGLSPGFKAISIGTVLKGNSSKSSSSSSMSNGVAAGGQQGQSGKAAAGESSMGKGGLGGGPKAVSEQAGPGGKMSPGRAGGKEQAAGSAPPNPARLPPPPPLSTATAKPSEPDPYGLEIGGGIVEPAVTTESTTKVTATTKVTTAPAPTTTTSATTTSATTSITTTSTKMPPCGPDVLFVLDSTGSVRLVYEEQKKYILDVAQQMEIAPNGQHVGLILYSSRLRQRIVVGLDEPQSKDQFLKRVSELPYHGGITATGNALDLTVKALAKRRPNKRTLVVLLTDGFTYDEWAAPARALQAAGVDIIVAGDVKIYVKSILDQIAGDPSRVLLGEENKAKALDYLRCR